MKKIPTLKRMLQIKLDMERAMRKEPATKNIEKIDEVFSDSDAKVIASRFSTEIQKCQVFF